MKLVDRENKVINLTNSARGTFDSCQRKFYYSNIHDQYGIRPYGTVSHALLYGDVVHAMFAEALSGTSTEEAILEAGYKIIRTAEEQIDAANVKGTLNIARVRASVPGLVIAAVHGSSWIRQEICVEGVEASVSTNIGTVQYEQDTYDVMLHGKLDVYGLRENGRLVIIDHKTMSMFRGAFYDRCLMDHQLTTYAILANSKMGLSPTCEVDTIYNCFRKPGLRLGKSESMKEFEYRISKYLQTTPIDDYMKVIRGVRDDGRILECRQTYLDVASQVLEAHYKRFWRQNMTVCDLYAGCEYLPLCAQGEHNLVNYVTRTTAHEELEEDDTW